MTFFGVDFVQGEPRRQRFHVWPELLREGVGELESGSAAADAEALGGHVSPDAVLQVEAHHAVELQVLQSARRIKNLLLGYLCIALLVFYVKLNLDLSGLTPGTLQPCLDLQWPLG